MGFANVYRPEQFPRPSTQYPDTYYCPDCRCTYTPGMIWANVVYARDSTNPSDDRYFNHRKRGKECPMCEKEPKE